MLLLLGKLAIGSVKLVVKYVLVPVAVSIVVAALADAATQKIEASTAATNERLESSSSVRHKNGKSVAA